MFELVTGLDPDDISFNGITAANLLALTALIIAFTHQGSTGEPVLAVLLACYMQLLYYLVASMMT